MQKLRTINTINPGDSKETTLDNWPQGLQADAIVLDCTFPVTVGTAGTPATSDLVNILAYFLNVLNLKYGRQMEFMPLVGISGQDLRRFHRFTEQKEVPNDFVGVAQTTGAKLFHARLTYAVRQPKMSGASNRGRIGFAQGRTIYLKVQEGQALTAGALNLSRTSGAPAIIAVKPIFKRGDNGRTPWTPLPAFSRTVFAGLDVLGPDGCPLVCYDENAAYGSTAITTYSFRVGDLEVISQVTPQTVDDEYGRTFDAGGSNIDDEVTILYAADPHADADELPRGRPYMRLVTQDVTQLKMGTWYIPPVSEQEADAAGAATASATGRPALGSTDILGDHAVQGAAATDPLEFVGPQDPRFTTVPGIVVDQHGNSSLSVPQAHINQAAGVVAQAPQETRGAMGARVFHAPARRIPGAGTTAGAVKSGAKAAGGVNAALLPAIAKVGG